MPLPAQPNNAHLSATQLRQRYMVALSLIALLTIVSQIVVQYLIADQEHDSRVINIAGRQRMLSQKITKTALYLHQASNFIEAEHLRSQLSDTLTLWQRSHRGLLQGDAELGLPGQNSPQTMALFERITEPHQIIVQAIETLLNPNNSHDTNEKLLKTVRENEPAFLLGMDAIVFRYDSEAKHKVAVARWLELALMAITLLVLLLEARYIFAPATRRIERDVSELQRNNADLQQLNQQLEDAQNQLLQADKMAAIGQLAAGVAHEINNPIGFVNSNMGTLRQYTNELLAIINAYGPLYQLLPDDDPRRQAIERALAHADLEFLREDIVSLLDESQQGLTRVRKIVLDLKSFSHVDQAEWSEADLNEGLESTLNVVWNEIKYKAEVIRNYAELPPVRCIAAQINQVFMNLLVNATHAIDKQGTITLSTAFDDNGIWVDISDTGKGMSAETCKRIFEPFFTTKPVGQGTGLGLSISWDIVVNRHQGRLEVHSQESLGTRFRVWLPRQTNEAS